VFVTSEATITEMVNVCGTASVETMLLMKCQTFQAVVPTLWTVVHSFSHRLRVPHFVTAVQNVHANILTHQARISAVLSPHHMSELQTFSYSSSQLFVSFGQVLDHSLLDRFINVPEIT
jgi:hypothetical protein